MLTVATSQLSAVADHQVDQPTIANQRLDRSVTQNTTTLVERSGYIERVIMRRVWVSGYYEARWIEPTIEVYTDDAGVQRSKLIRDGLYQNQWVPGRYEAVPVVQRIYAPVQRQSNYGTYSDRTNLSRYASNRRSARIGQQDELYVRATPSSLY